ncbi:hypothetical protein EMIT093MI4_150058 [Pseudomonas sp. IT-93MI4]
MWERACAQLFQSVTASTGDGRQGVRMAHCEWEKLLSDCDALKGGACGYVCSVSEQF